MVRKNSKVYGEKDFREGRSKNFKVDYFHHFKDDEELKGYLEPKLDFYMSPTSSKCYYEFSCNSLGQNVEDPIKYFETQIPGGIIKDKKEFLELVEKDKEFSPSWPKVQEITTSSGEIFEVSPPN